MNRTAVPVLRMTVAAIAVSALNAQSHGAPKAIHYDSLIAAARVLDGSGNPWFQADIGIENGKIVMIGHQPDATASRTIDARGKYVVPGFIDMHCHADDSVSDHVLRDKDVAFRAAPNLVAQGITTVVVNPDGASPWPIQKQRLDLEQAKFGPNAVLMVGHNTIRKMVMGSDYRRPATSAEIDKMREMVRQGMSEGAFGLTSGLEYVPGIWSDTHELVELVKEIVPFGGIYSEHERSSGDAPMWWKPSKDAASPVSLMDSVQETIAIGEQTGAPVVLTHMKVRGMNSWGGSQTIIDLVNQARSRGVQVWGDQYPYNSSGSDGVILLIPDWAIGLDMWGTNGAAQSQQRTKDYASALRRTMADAAASAKLKVDIAHEIEFRGGADQIVVFDYPDRTLIGKSLGDIARSRKTTPVEMAIALQLEGYSERKGGARLRSFSFSDSDVEALMRQPWVATSTDAEIAYPGDGDGEAHPRYLGSYPRKIRHYVIDKKAITLEDAIRSSTSLPAQILGIEDRGLLREGYAADIVVMDLARIGDNATFEKPSQYSDGIDDVMVNGTLVVDGGKLTGALPGVVLDKRKELYRH